MVRKNRFSLSMIASVVSASAGFAISVAAEQSLILEEVVVSVQSSGPKSCKLFVSVA